MQGMIVEVSGVIKTVDYKGPAVMSNYDGMVYPVKHYHRDWAKDRIGEPVEYDLVNECSYGPDCTAYTGNCTGTCIDMAEIKSSADRLTPEAREAAYLFMTTVGMWPTVEGAKAEFDRKWEKAIKALDNGINS